MSEVAKVGDKVKIIDADKSGLRTARNETVVEIIRNDGDLAVFQDSNSGMTFALFADTYEIVERAEENLGMKKAEVGDKILVLNTSQDNLPDYLSGHTFDVTDISVNGNGIYITEPTIDINWYVSHENYSIVSDRSEYEPIEPFEDEVDNALTVYISGPMTGKEDYNYPLFYEVEKSLTGRTFTLDEVSYTITEVINPAALDEELGIEGMVWHDFLKRDMEVIFGRDVDAVILFDDWENSRGANLEMYVASQAGKMILNFDLQTEELTTADLSVAYEAQSIVLGKRRYDYGHPLDNFLNIATLWDGTLRMAGKLADGASIDIRDVYALMEQIKIAREYNAPKRDNQVDVAGYAYAYETSKQEAVRRGMDLSDMMDADLKKLRENGSNGFGKTLKG